MDVHGVSGVVTVVLLIVIVLAGAVVVGNLVFFYTDKTEGKGDSLGVVISLEKVSVSLSGVNATVFYKVGTEELSTLRFLLFDAHGNSKSVEVTENLPAAHEMHTFTLQIPEGFEGIPLEVAVVPIIGNTLGVPSSQKSVHLIPLAVTEGLVAWWPLNDGSGSIAKDTRAVFDGTIVGATWSNDSEHGSVLRFDGINDYVTTGGTQSLGNFTAYTYAVWANPAHLPSGYKPALVQKGNWNNWFYIFGEKIASHASCMGNNGVSRSNIIVPSVQWSFFVTTFDNSSSPSIRIYQDGSDVDSYLTYTPCQGAMNFAASDTSLRIGANSGFNAAQFFNGSMHDVMVFNRSLSADEVRNLYILTAR